MSRRCRSSAASVLLVLLPHWVAHGQSVAPATFCKGKPYGQYGDVGSGCIGWFTCAETGSLFYPCPGGTLFDNTNKNCNWPDKVDKAMCSSANSSLPNPPLSPLSPVQSTSPPPLVSSPAPPSSKPAGRKLVGYLGNWYMYSNGGKPYDLSKFTKMTHINYAFASISYSITSDTYYVDVTDAWADVGACSTGVCPGKCIPLNTTCTANGQPHMSLVPNTKTQVGGCPASNSCFNSGGGTDYPRKCMTSTVDLQLWSPGAACGTYSWVYQYIRTQAPSVRALLSLGGWYDSNFFSPAVTDKYRAKFVDSVVAFVETFAFDGIDIDWEFPGFEHIGQPVYGTSDYGSPDDVRDCSKDTCKYPRNDDGANFMKFLKDLKSKLAGKVNRLGEPYLVTMAGPSIEEKLSKMPLGEVCATLDWINIMTYDMWGAWENVTGHQSAVYSRASTDVSVDSAVKAYIKGGCPASKLVVGTPFYGRAFYGVPSTGPVSGLPGFQVPYDRGMTNWQSPENLMPSYNVVKAKGWPTYWDSVAQASYTFDPTSKMWITYDSPQAVTAKVNYIKSQGLAGAMVWALGQDDGTLWAVVSSVA